jgi:EF hand domain-containing protein
MRSLAALALALVAASAYADKTNDGYFRSLDLNGDGFVSLSEAAGDEVVVSRFDRADRNRDGKLSPKEFANLKNVKVRVATRKKDKDKEPSAAVGGTAPRPASGLKPRRKDRTDGVGADGG